MRWNRILPCLVMAGLAAGGPLRAESLFDPRTMMTIDQIRPGMKGVARSCFHGTAIDQFDVTVLGVAQRLAFNGEMILIRIENGPVVEHGYGIIEGMSGSPVYVNGKLIGAIAYGWAFAKEPIAGVQPIAQMIEDFEPGSAPRPLAAGSLAPPGGALTLSDRTIRRIAVVPSAPAGRSDDPAMMVLSPIPTPVAMTGMGAADLSRLRTILKPFNMVPLAAVAGARTPGASAPLQPGSPIGVRLAGGDIDLTAIGTVTYVKGDQVLAFGHPMFGSGPVDLPLVSAYVHGVLSSLEASFKLASAGETIGRLTQDRSASVGGTLGPAASMIDASFAVTDRDRNVRHSYHVDIARHRDLTPLLMSIIAGEALGTVAPSLNGTTRLTFDLTAKGLPPIHRENTFGTSSDALSMLMGSGSPLSELDGLVGLLEDNPFARAEVERVSVQADVTAKRESATIERAFLSQSQAKPGETVDLTVVVRPLGAPPVTRVFPIQVPAHAAPGNIRIGVSGGGSAPMVEEALRIQRPEPRSLAQLIEYLLYTPRNNDLAITLAFPTVGIDVDGRRLSTLPSSVVDLFASLGESDLRPSADYSFRTEPQPWMVAGGELMALRIETEEKEKSAPPRPSSPGGSMPPGFMGGGPEGMPEDMEEEWEAKATRLLAMGGMPDMESEPDWEEGDMEEDDEEEPASPEDDAPPAPPAARAKALGRLAVTWTDITQKDFAAGRGEGVAVGSAGTVMLSPALAPIGETPSVPAWALAANGDGVTYLGSWHGGQVFRRDGKGEVALFATLPAIAVQSLALDGAGRLYAGTAPDGVIYRITADGTATPFARLEATAVWALAISPAGTLLAGTGPEGKLFAVSPQGDATVLFAAPDRHVIAVAPSPAGGCYFATYDKGKVYRLDADAVVSTAFEDTKSAIQSLAVDAQGILYVGTSPQAAVFRIDPAGGARRIFTSPDKERHVFALAVADGKVYAATGIHGYLYEIDADDTYRTLTDRRGDAVVALAPASGGRMRALSANGQLLDLGLGEGAEGVFRSRPYDAKAPARWGAIRWDADIPDGASLQLETRSGNTATPDAAWSEWSAPVLSQVTSPPAQFLQYRTVFSAADGKRPVLRSVRILARARNRAPEMSLKAPVGGEYWSGKQTIRWAAQDPDRDKLTPEVSYSSDGGKTWTELKAPAANARGNAGPGGGGPSPGGPEEDGAGPGGPQPPGPPGPPTATRPWDLASIKDGAYQVRVRVTDAEANPEDPLRDEEVSKLLTIDNTAPALVFDRRRQATDPPPAVVSVHDVTSYVASAEYRVDKGEWMAAVAADGVFDSVYEDVKLDAAKLPEGSHQVELRARDAAGNQASGTFSYSSPKRAATD